MSIDGKSKRNIGSSEDAPADPFYVWQASGKRFTVNLSLRVVDRIGMAILEGFYPLPGRGLETGGLLLGRTKRKRGSVLVEIESFEPVDCEHAAGPSYLLSDNDRVGLEERIRSHKAAGGLSIVGFYRSHTRKDFIASIEDAYLMSAYFSEPSNVFLLIHAHRDGPPTAGFAIWEGRGAFSMTPNGDFPFRAGALLSGGHEIQSVPVTKPAPRRELRLGMQWRPQLKLPALPRLNLTWPTLPRFKVAWPAAVKFPEWARFNAEWVSRLRSSRRPGFNLEWLAAAGAGAALVFLVIGIPAVLSRRTVPAAASVPPASAVIEPAGTGVAARAIADLASPAPPLAVPQGNADALDAAAPRGTAYRKKDPTRESNFRMPASAPSRAAVMARSATPEMPALTEAPALAVPVVAGKDPLRFGETGMLKSRAPDAFDPFVSVAVEPATESEGGGLIHKLSLFGKGKRSKRTDFVPPAPIRRAPTNVPPELRGRIKHETPVDVKVYVDRTGRVEYAELLSEGTGPDRDLASLAVFSSRRWQFSPAHLGEEAVPAEVVLRFRFGPGSAAR
jgi:outer membrane biosynthesis protein TonB